MGEVIGDMLPAAVAVALSPLPIMAAVLVLVSARGRVNGVAYLTGQVVGVAGLGALAAANPKNLILIVAGMGAIAQTGISAGEQAVELTVFTAISSLGVAIPVILYFALGERSGDLLEKLKTWPVANSAVIMAVVLLLIGAKLIGDAIAGF